MKVDYRVWGIRTRSLSIWLSLAGLLDSLYLSWIKLTGSTAVCGNIADCDVVNSSRFAEIGGIPVALIGAGGYILIAGLLFLEPRSSQLAETVRMAVFGLTLLGVLFSAYLTYIEVAVIKAICPFCIVSAIIMTILFSLSIVSLRESAMLE